MANEKQYAQFIDIPNNSGGTDRKWLRDAEAATKEELEAASTATMFQLYVDPTDLHLKGKKTGYGTFEVVDGHLILHQTE